VNETTSPIGPPQPPTWQSTPPSWQVPAPPPAGGEPASEPPTPRRGWKRAGLVTLALVAVAGGTVGGALAGRAQVSDETPTAAAPVAEPTALEEPVVTTEPDISDLVEATLPSVVRIDSVTSLGSGTGTGFVMSADGLIATNAHVVGDAVAVEVGFSDGSSATATVLGTSRTDDLAVIEVDRDDLVPVEFGSSTDLEVGQRVVAIGNSLGLDGSATATDGIVSAVGRSIQTNDGNRLDDLIQTDAAINPGNSGGPLFTLDGKVVGINSAGSPSAQNVGFAIASDAAKPVLDALATGEPIIKPFLGISTSPVTPELAARLGLDENGDVTGAVVVEVNVGSAAEMAGLRAGDLITAIDGEQVESPEDVGAVIAESEPGDTIGLEVLRAGETLDVEAVLGSRRS
jgi:putative serine protease PepD